MVGVRWDNTLGADFVGVILSSILFGVLGLQTYVYFVQSTKKDRIWLKLLVCLILICNAAHLSLYCHVFYYYTITHFGDILNFLRVPPWTLGASFPLGGMVTSIVQIFFAGRIYQLSAEKAAIISVFTTLLSLAQLVVNCLIGHKFITSPSISLGFLRSQHFFLISQSLGVCCNVFITISMIYYLIKSRSRFEKSNKVISLLIFFSVNTCLLLTLVAITSISMWAAYPLTSLPTPTIQLSVQLYGNTLLATLNNRKRLRGILNSIQSTNPLHPDGFGAGGVTVTVTRTRMSWHEDDQSEQAVPDDKYIELSPHLSETVNV